MNHAKAASRCSQLADASLTKTLNLHRSLLQYTDTWEATLQLLTNSDINSMSMPCSGKIGPLQDIVKVQPVIVGGVWREVFEQDGVNAAGDVVAVGFVHRLARIVLHS